MKKLISILAVVLFVAVFSINCSAQNKNQKAQPKYEEVTFVTTIDCEHCVKKCEANLPYEKGVKDCKVTLDDLTIYFKYDPAKTDKAKLKKAIQKLGYEAEEIVIE
ncbi:MAG: heavy-metal-associated domain-containing protein [Bacteroidales bacterium]|nr:heavy-metal-associated domain-containing protein [Bacteroidales bacterium]